MKSMNGFFTSKTLATLTGTAAALLLLTAFALYLNLDQLPGQIVIRFDAARGVGSFGQTADVWGLIGLGVGMVAMNVALGAAFFERERAVSYLLSGVNLLVALLVAIAVAIIISAN